MKAHNLARLVNDLRDVANSFRYDQSLRDRISQTLSDHGINEGWPTLDEYHLLALTFAYEKGFLAGLEGRNTENVFGQAGGQSAAFDVGLQEGRAASQRRTTYVPHGWKLVPIEPTTDMVCEMEKQWFGSQIDMAKREWKAALAAAPEVKP